MPSERHSSGFMTKLIAGLFLFVFTWVLIAAIAYVAGPEKKGRPVIGGLRDFTVIVRAENTYENQSGMLRFFERALAIDCEAVIEVDVWKTADGKAVVSPDAMVEGPDGSPVGIGKVTAAGLATLEDVLDRFPEAVKYIVIREQDDGFADSVLMAVKSRGQSERVIIGAVETVIKRIRGKYPEFATAFSEEETFIFNILQKLQISGFFSVEGDIFITPEFSGSGESGNTDRKRNRGFRLVAPSFISTAHRYDIPVIVRDVRSEDAMQRLVKWGIDGIISDYSEEFYRRANEEGLFPR